MKKETDYKRLFSGLIWMVLGMLILIPITISFFVNNLFIIILSFISEIIILLVFFGFGYIAVKTTKSKGHH